MCAILPCVCDMEVRTVQHAGGGVKGGPPRDGVQAGRPTAPASKALNRTSFDANRVSISFPFTPYQCQQVFVAKLVEALQKGQNALLESPTGTGKVSAHGRAELSPTDASPQTAVPHARRHL